jgi:hypothetical protein
LRLLLLLPLLSLCVRREREHHVIYVFTTTRISHLLHDVICINRVVKRISTPWSVDLDHQSLFLLPVCLVFLLGGKGGNLLVLKGQVVEETTDYVFCTL